MAKCWERVNLDLTRELRSKTDIALGSGHFLEAATSISAFVEGMLRNGITILLRNKEDTEKYWNNTRTTFATLIDTFELLGGDNLIIKELREFKDVRNNLVHGVFGYESLEVLYKEADNHVKVGKEIIEHFGQVYGDRPELLPDHPKQFKPIKPGY